MGFSFTTIESNQLGQVTKWDVPLNDWAGLKFGNGNNDTFGNAISRATEDFIWDDDNPVRPDVLNRTYGIEGQLKFDKPLSAQRARLMHERKRKELESLAYVESASHSWASAKAAVGFGAALVGGLSHPVDLGLAFLPFIGSEKAAAGVAKMGGGAFRQGIARGLLAEESLALPGGRLTAAVIDGVVNQAIVEIPVAIQKHRDQAIYGLEDSAFNILAGGVFAGALKGLGLALERAGKLWREADPRIREAALMDTANTIVTGEPPRVHEYFGLDEATIRQKVEAKVRAEFPFTLRDAYPTGSDVRFRWPEGGEASGRVIEHTDSGAIKLEVAGKEFPVFVRESEIITPEARPIVDLSSLPPEQLEALSRKSNALERAARRSTSASDLAEILRQAEGLPFEGRIAIEVAQNTHTDAATFEAAARNPEAQKTTLPNYFESIRERRMTPEQNAIREQSINDFLAKAKAEHEARLQGIIDHETRRVLDEIKTRTPQTPQADIDRYTVKGTPDDASIKAVEEDAADMAEQALNVARTPEERVALKAQIDKELSEVVTGEKAIDHMIPCVTQRAKQ